MDIKILKKALEASWNIDTCHKPMKKDYAKNHPSYGQCYPTTLIVNDFFGGKILKYKFPETEIGHFSNLIDGKEVDLSREQFDKDESFPKPQIIDRKTLKTSKAYLILRSHVNKYLTKNYPDKEIEKLSYRQGILAVILNSKKQILIISAPDEPDYWRFPSGGVDPGETHEQTVHRELKEELNIEVDIIKRITDVTNKFIWPKIVIKKHNNKYKGQQKHIFITRIKPNQNIILQEEEIGGYKWVNKEEVENYFLYPNQRSTAKKIFDDYKEFF